MNDLEKKCKSEKYFNSIKYFYHLLPAPKKEEFLLQVASHNIFLAAQCLMTDTKDEEVENRIKSIAIHDSQEFSNRERSSLALLALAEFELHEKILALFNSLPKLEKDHIAVLSRVFIQTEEENYMRFLKVLTESENLGATLVTFLSYKGEISINIKNVSILNVFLNKLLASHYSSFIKLFFDQFDLWSDAELLFGNDLKTVINWLLKGTVKDVKLAYHLAEKANLFQDFPVSGFIELLSKSNVKRFMNFTLSLALKYNIYDCKGFNQKLLTILKTATRKNQRTLKFLISKGLINYTQNVPTLTDLMEGYLKNPETFVENLNVEVAVPNNANLENKGLASANLVKFSNIFSIVFGQDYVTTLSSNTISLEEYWKMYFQAFKDKEMRLPIEPFLVRSPLIYNCDLRLICSVLNKIKQKGIVTSQKAYGYYITPLTFLSGMLCFLHPDQIGGIDNPGLSFNESLLDKEIVFYITGYNKTTNRINISLKQSI